jgi:hypothetical protein
MACPEYYSVILPYRRDVDMSYVLAKHKKKTASSFMQEILKHPQLQYNGKHSKQLK